MDSRLSVVKWPQRRFAQSTLVKLAPSKELRSSAKHLALDYVLNFKKRVQVAHAVLPNLKVVHRLTRVCC